VVYYENLSLHLVPLMNASVVAHVPDITSTVLFEVLFHVEFSKRRTLT